ncbi:MAG: hypothetical protein WD645_06150 [Dehalococcoidia bacterium]
MTNAAPVTTIEIYIPGLGPRGVSAASPVPPHLRQLIARMDDRQKFWVNRNWPEDAYGKVFLGRAVLRVGEAMHPDEWTGHEPGVDTLLRPLPTFSSQAPPWEARQAVEAVPANNKMPKDERTRYIPRSTIDHRDWVEAVRIRNLVLAELAGPRERFSAAMFQLREAMKAEPGQPNAVKFHVLDAKTGDFSAALPHKWWNTTENWLARFYWCQINLQQPITPAVGGEKFQRVFVDGADLERLIDSLAPVASPPDQKKRGPRPKNDDALVEKMRALMDSEEPPNSPWDAARIIATGNLPTAEARRLLESSMGTPSRRTPMREPANPPRVASASPWSITMQPQLRDRTGGQRTAASVPQGTATAVPQRTIVAREPARQVVPAVSSDQRVRLDKYGIPTGQVGFGSTPPPLPRPRPAPPAAVPPVPMPHTGAIKARANNPMAAIPETGAERMWAGSQFARQFDQTGAGAGSFADMQAMMSRPMPTVPVPQVPPNLPGMAPLPASIEQMLMARRAVPMPAWMRPQMPQRQPLNITVPGWRPAPTVGRRPSLLGAVMPSGNIYAPASGGGYVNQRTGVRYTPDTQHQYGSNGGSYGSDPGQITAGLQPGDRVYDASTNSWGLK